MVVVHLLCLPAAILVALGKCECALKLSTTINDAFLSTVSGSLFM